MNKLGCLIIMFFTCGFCSGQNLVPNFSFEQYDTCPDSQDQIERCIGWHKCNPASNTPDYYNTCATPGYFNVPNSGNGYQQDHRNCTAFAGLITYVVPIPNYRELIGIQLNQPLIIGQKYFLSFYTVMAECIQSNGHHQGMPSNNIGMRLSTVSYSINNPCPVDNFSHLYSLSIINDSTNWNRITGSVIADSAYNFLILGNFFDDLHTDTLNFTCGSCYNIESYYYVDDVCISTDSLLCNGGIDNIPCNVGINENVSSSEVSIFPNPISDKLNIAMGNKELSEIIVYDVSSRKLMQKKFTNSVSINTEQLAKGLYLYEVRGKDGSCKKGKVVKN